MTRTSTNGTSMIVHLVRRDEARFASVEACERGERTSSFAMSKWSPSASFWNVSLGGVGDGGGVNIVASR